METPQPIVFGIVGGIGSGKSFTSAEFISQGAVCFDADKEAQKLYLDEAIRKQLRAQWPEIFAENDELCKTKLAQLVFAPTEEGQKNLCFLNNLLRPTLLARFQNWLQEQRAARKRFVILDAPLLLEAGWEVSVDYLVFVEASRQTRLQRIRKRNWTDEELTRREACQLPIAEKKRQADFIIDADRDESHIDEQVKKILGACVYVR